MTEKALKSLIEIHEELIKIDEELLQGVIHDLSRARREDNVDKEEHFTREALGLLRNQSGNKNALEQLKEQLK